MAIAVYRVTDRAVGAGVGGHEGDEGEEEDLHGLAFFNGIFLAAN